MSEYEKLTIEDVQEYFEKKLNKACYICGENNWEYSLPTAESVALPIRKDENLFSETGQMHIAGWVPSAMINCSNCGHIILIARNKITEWKKKNGS
jgi:hypothetical protein